MKKRHQSANKFEVVSLLAQGQSLDLSTGLVPDISSSDFKIWKLKDKQRSKKQRKKKRFNDKRRKKKS